MIFANKQYIIIVFIILIMLLLFLTYMRFRKHDHDSYSTIENVSPKLSINNNVKKEIIIKKEGPKADLCVQRSGDPELLHLVEELSPERDLQDLYIVPVLLSPKDYNSPSADSDTNSLEPEVLELFKNHNAAQDKISSIILEGQSLWPGFSERFWPLHLEYNRADENGFIQSKDEHCKVYGKIILSYNKEGYGSMQVNALHLLIFRKYDPKKFYSVEDGHLLGQKADGREVSIPVKVIKSEQETLYFEVPTGHLVQAEIQFDKNVVKLSMDKFVLIDKARDVVLPTLIKIKVPDEFFTVPLGSKPKFGKIIQLTIDPNEVRIE